MAMLPILVLGVLVGTLLGYSWCNLKRNTPSVLQMEFQEKEIERQKKDNEMLMKLNNKLYAEIDELKNQLSAK